MTVQADGQREMLAVMKDMAAANGRIANNVETLVEGGHRQVAAAADGEDTRETGNAAGEEISPGETAAADAGNTDREETAEEEAGGPEAQADDEADGGAAEGKRRRRQRDDAGKGRGIERTRDRASGRGGDARGNRRHERRGSPGQGGTPRPPGEDAGGPADKAAGNAAGEETLPEEAAETVPPPPPTLEEIVAALTESLPLDRIAAALAGRLPLAELDARLEGFAASFAALQEGARSEAARSEEISDEALRQTMDVLGSVRDDLTAHGELLKGLHRTPPTRAVRGGPGTRHPPRGVPAPQGRAGTLFDTFINSLGAMLGPRKKEEKDEDGKKTQAEAKAPAQPRLPPPEIAAVKTAAADLSRQLRAERRSFTRFAWIAAAALGIALPVALALGILIQHEYVLLAAPDDPTMGWKDRVWSEIGPEASRCISKEDSGSGDCIITITPPPE